MNIIVFIKQIPDSDEVKLDETAISSAAEPGP